jgi:hypothetical protein
MLAANPGFRAFSARRRVRISSCVFCEHVPCHSYLRCNQLLKSKLELEVVHLRSEHDDLELQCVQAQERFGGPCWRCPVQKFLRELPPPSNRPSHDEPPPLPPSSHPSDDDDPYSGLELFCLEKEVLSGVQAISELTQNLSEISEFLQQLRASIETARLQRGAVPSQENTIRLLTDQVADARTQRSDLRCDLRDLIASERREFAALHKRLASVLERNRTLGRDFLTLQERQHAEVMRLRALIAADDAVELSSESILDVNDISTDSTSIMSVQSQSLSI